MIQNEMLLDHICMKLNEFVEVDGSLLTLLMSYFPCNMELSATSVYVYMLSPFQPFVNFLSIVNGMFSYSYTDDHGNEVEKSIDTKITEKGTLEFYVHEEIHIKETAQS